MYWSIYIFSSLLICSIIGRINKKYYSELFFLSVIFFLTPTTIEVSNSDYAPSLFTFFFNLLLEQNFSTRPLRPLLMTIPASVFALYLFKIFKRKFF